MAECNLIATTRPIRSSLYLAKKYSSTLADHLILTFYSLTYQTVFSGFKFSVWLGVGNITTWLGLGEDHGLS